MKLSFEMRPAYAFVAVAGPVEPGDSAAIRQMVRERAARHDSSRVLVDLRDASFSREARDEILELARAPEAVSAAVITSDELFVAEVNMASLAAASRVRAFPRESEAHRWLARGSVVKTAVDIPATHPQRSVDVEARRRALLEPPPKRSGVEVRPGRQSASAASEHPTPATGTPRKR